jgi:excisionase family DNA binding protein
VYPQAARTPADDPDALLTKAEAQAVLSVSSTTLNRLIAAKELDVVRIGGRGRGAVRITRRAIRDYTERHTTRAAANERRGARQ